MNKESKKRKNKRIQIGICLLKLSSLIQQKFEGREKYLQSSKTKLAVESKLLYDQNKQLFSEIEQLGEDSKLNN